MTEQELLDLLNTVDYGETYTVSDVERRDRARYELGSVPARDAIREVLRRNETLDRALRSSEQEARDHKRVVMQAWTALALPDTDDAKLRLDENIRELRQRTEAAERRANEATVRAITHETAHEAAHEAERICEEELAELGKKIDTVVRERELLHEAVQLYFEKGEADAYRENLMKALERGQPHWSYIVALEERTKTAEKERDEARKEFEAVRMQLGMEATKAWRDITALRAEVTRLSEENINLAYDRDETKKERTAARRDLSTALVALAGARELVIDERAATEEFITASISESPAWFDRTNAARKEAAGRTDAVLATYATLGSQVAWQEAKKR